MYKIFIVEDHPVIRRSYRKLLGRDPQITVCGEAASGEQALELLPDADPDLVVLDIFMPGMNGIELLSHLKEQYPTLPVIVISGHDGSSYVSEALRLGASQYLSKSQVATVLASTIHETLEKTNA